MCSTRHVHYPIVSMIPVIDQEISGFDIEFELADGSLAKAELRSNRPSWKRIIPISPSEKSKIRIDAFNHHSLKTQTLDHEIAEVHLPI